MADDYSWQDFRDEGPARLPGPDHLGWWVMVSLLLAVILHGLAFLVLGHVKILLPFQEAEEIRTQPIQFDRVEVLPPEMDDIAPEPDARPVENATQLLEEIDVLTQLPEDHELDISPETIDPEFAIKPAQPAAEGAPEAPLEFDASVDFDLASELPEMGRTENPLPPAEEGQVIVDPGAALEDDPSLDAFTADILRRGQEGGAEEGSLDGVVSLDDMVGLPENVLVGKKTMLPSDLLFEYNSAELRESARVGLMKLALLVERNPGLYCWIEGYTDLYGTDSYNLDLSSRRAESVKEYLTHSLRIAPDKIATRGFGKSQPIVRSGSIDEQAPNRRVEIKMRRQLPPAQIEVPKAQPEPPKPEPMQEMPEQSPPKAILVKPARPLLIEPADEPGQPPKATVVEEPPPRARVVEEEPAPRAVPVEE
ncbi:OmpA family protein [Haloferula sargassicola]|uniref:OmpA family protein n=1 Tax=Haloferula sargassicola TaxID=490096 RepID=UPI003365A7BC